MTLSTFFIFDSGWCEVVPSSCHVDAVYIFFVAQFMGRRREVFAKTLWLIGWLNFYTRTNWMIVEFFWPAIETLRYYAAIPFSIGILFIGVYYFIILPREKKNEKLVSITVEVSETALQLAKAR